MPALVSKLQIILYRYLAMPEPVRIVGTACIGAAIGFVTYLLINAMNPLEPRATTSWFLAFLINVSRQHALHRWLTFKYSVPYWRSLGRAYVMYSGTAVMTTTLNWYVTVQLSWNHHLAWLACLGLTASISLIFLKRFVFNG
jgi:branched-subunit amino acid ABC-type transport system permease component